MKTRLLFSSVLFCICCLAEHPTRAQEFPQLLFDNYSTADGLSSYEVHATLRDQKGFLWVATGNGLNRFDGYSFKTFLQISGDSTSIGNNTVFALAEDSKGLLWVGTGNGLYRYDPLTERFSGSFLPKTIGSSGFDVKQIYLDEQDCLWMGSSVSVGLFRYDTRSGQFDSFVNRAAQKFGGGNLITDIWKDKNDLIWLGTFNGLFTFQAATGEFENMLHSPAEKDKFRDFVITSLLQDQYRERLLWLTTWGDGLWKYDKITGKSERFLQEPQFPYDGIHNVFLDAIQPDSNHLWLGAGDLVSFDIKNGIFSHKLSQHPSLPLKVNIQEFHTDAEGNIWMSGAGGFGRLSALRQQFGVKKIPTGLPVRAILDDTSARKIYFGTIYLNRSLVIFDKITGAWETRHLPLLDEMHAGPFKLLKDRRGLLWFITNRGLFRYELRKNRLETKEVFFENGESSTMHYCSHAEEDADGNIYFRFDNRHIVRYDYAQDSLILTPYQANALGKTKDGSLLLVSEEGIRRLPPQGKAPIFIPFPLPVMAGISPSAIASDFVGQYWIGTHTSGIFRLKTGENGASTATRLGLENGLPSTFVHHLTCDPDGNIWAGTRQGLVKIDPATLRTTIFTQENGLLGDGPDSEISFLPSGEAFLSLSVSSLYYHFDFRKLRQPDLDSLPFHFHNFRIAGKPAVFEKDINYLPNITLNYPANAFSVEFAALSMEGQKSIRYAYRLDGLEEEWTDAAAFRYAAYANLPPGQYRLEVRMSNRRGFWSKNIHSLNVIVLPAWWQRTWVRILAGILLVGLVSLAVASAVNQRLRQRIAALERQRELENIRRRIAQDIHDEAGAGLTKIGLTAQVAAHLPASENKELKRRLEAILAETRRVSARLSEVLFAVNPRYDHFEAMQAWLREWSRRFLEDAKMEAEFDLPKSNFDPVLSPEIKRNLLLILKEALNNAVKYSGSDLIHITFSLDESGRHYLLRVQDFGRGFQSNEVSSFSNGIAGMKSRAVQIGASFTMKIEKGVSISVSGMISPQSREGAKHTK